MGMVFGDVIRYVVRVSVDVKVALLGTITDPMEYRIKTTRFLLADVILYNTVSCRFICFERRTGFGMFVAWFL